MRERERERKREKDGVREQALVPILGASTSTIRYPKLGVLPPYRVVACSALDSRVYHITILLAASR